ncbi:MAG: pyrroline-5-carboxylate reductase [Pseudolabrys sp.]|nr:pyrroline-5-carboxylate reductase [Pseudolabrys sp.]
MTQPRRKDGLLRSLPGRLVLLGAGKMGTALLEGWLARGLDPRKLVVLEPRPSAPIKALVRRGAALNPERGAGPTTAVVIAVKPQNASEALARLAPFVQPATLALSIMAGRKIEFVARALPGLAVVRAMPNTPAAVGCGITVACAGAKVSARQRKLASELLAAVGQVEWIADEGLMDAVTAVSGSGPAYVFLLAEAMTQAGIAAGLPAALAARLARETVVGAGELLRRSDLDAPALRENVTSPGGTTAAALEVLTGPGGLRELLTRAVAAATRRGRELAG